MSLRCPECAVDHRVMSVANACELIEGFGTAFGQVFESRLDEAEVLRTRPSAESWSPLEYAVHVRDLVRYHGALIQRALTEDRPELPPPDPDRAAREGRYNAEDAEAVLEAIDTQSRRFAGRARHLTEGELARVVVRGGQEVPVIEMVRNVAHEGAHHLNDIRRLLT